MPSSSIIGVAIAVGGNVIISLALTVQKLAHRRLEQQASPSVTPSVTPSPPTNAESECPRHTTAPVQGEANDGPRDAEPTIHIIQPSPVRQTFADSVRKSSDVLSEDSSDDDESSPVAEGAYLGSKLWWLGLALMSVGEFGNFLSYGFAQASVVAPLGTVALVANCIFAPLMLKERFRLKDLVGVGLAILGAVTVVWASNDSNRRLDPEQLRQAILRPTFIAYTGVNVVLMIVLTLLSRSSYGVRYIGVDVGLCALFGGFTVLSTKAISSLLSRMFFTAFRFPIAWFLVFVLATTSIAQIKYLNKALMRFESKEVIPTQFVFFSIAAIVGSAVLYEDFRDIPFVQLANFFFGIATTFLGVYLLTSTFMSSNSTPSTPEPEAEFPEMPAGPGGLESVGEETPLLLPVPLHGSFPKRIKISKRKSNSNLTPSMGSQAGFLLLATTPPVGVSLRRERSASRGQGSVGSYGDERGIRRNSLGR